MALDNQSYWALMKNEYLPAIHTFDKLLFNINQGLPDAYHKRW